MWSHCIRLRCRRCCRTQHDTIIIMHAQYTSDKHFYVSDVSARLYRPSAYYAAKTTAVLPFAVLSALTFAYIVYGACQETANKGRIAAGGGGWLLPQPTSG